ncbi:MAG: rod shape-determining protein RodA [Kiritimatiellae bacterium]|nr:rod shape-determining protein RodA [Kiritimatiellia bacterium]
MIGAQDIRLLKRLHWPMALAVLALLVIGVLFVYSACYQSEDQPVNAFYRKQLVWALLGLACFVVFAVMDYRRLGEVSWWLYGISVVLLLLVLFVGRRVHGAKRWLSFFGVYVQPAELAKLAAIVYLGRLLSRPGLNLKHPKHVLRVALIVALPALLIIKQPDLGTAVVFMPVAIIMMFVAGVSTRTLGILMLTCVLLTPLSWFAMDEYQKNRLAVFVNPERDPLGAGWNKMQSEIAVGSGGLLGKGWKGGTQNILGFLPRSVAPTDFVFSVIAEEKGFVGSTIVLLLYVGVLTACMRAALVGTDKLGRLICVGIAAMMFFHVFVNVGMTIGIMPITGLPLPLISYGGSFTIVSLIALGIVQSVYVRRYRH